MVLTGTGREQMSKNNRPDQSGTHRRAFEAAKRKIYATQTICGICGKPVDFSKKYPHPLSPCIDHIIPLAKGGHPSDLANLQLAHWTCNRQKSDKLIERKEVRAQEVISNRVLPHSIDWKKYRPTKQSEAKNKTLDEQTEEKARAMKQTEETNKEKRRIVQRISY